MGMAASQARLLSITARMTDVEYKSQQISNTKIRLADESEEVAEAYTKALNKQKLTFTSYSKEGPIETKPLNPTNLSEAGLTLYSRETNKPLTAEEISAMKNVTSSVFYEMIQSGQFYLVSNTETDDNGKPKEVSVDGTNSLAIASDTTELAKAEAEYNAKTAKINKKEKLLDNDLKALDTEHNALKTEYDSVKSLISDNVSKSFNLFS